MSPTDVPATTSRVALEMRYPTGAVNVAVSTFAGRCRPSTTMADRLEIPDAESPATPVTMTSASPSPLTSVTGAPCPLALADAAETPHTAAAAMTTPTRKTD